MSDGRGRADEDGPLVGTPAGGTAGSGAGGREAGGSVPAGGSGGGGGSGADEPLPNLFVRVGELLLAPGRLFDRLRERPAWIGAVVLMVVIGGLTTWLMPEELLREAATMNMPADAAAEQVETAARFARVGGYVGSVLGPPVAVAALAGVLLFVFNVVLGGTAGYRQLLSVGAHAMLVPALGGLLVLPLMIAGNDPSVALALHLLVPGLEEGFLYRLLHGLNVFGIWATVLLGLGISRLYPERSFGGSAATVLALYLVMKLAWAFLGGLGGA